MSYSPFGSLKLKIVLIFSLMIAIAFAINWQIAVRTIHGEKISDLEKVLNHLLVESKDEYLTEPLDLTSNLDFLHRIPHNVLILKDSEASHVRFVVAKTPYVAKADEVSASVVLDNGLYLSAISDQRKIENALAKYGAKLSMRYLVSLFVILIIGFILLHYYMKPLMLLARRAQEWKNGDSFDVALQNPGQEIEELAKAFSALVQRLEGFRAKEKALFKEMAHELKTPIALMRARLDVYESSEAVPKQKMLRELGSDIERLMSELKNILFFEGSDFEEVSACDMGKILSEILQKVQILARRRGLKIVHSGESFRILVPRKLFGKLLTALIENALTYAKENSDICILLDPEDKSIAITNEIGGEKYLFSSKIGQKMLDRIAKEIGIEYRINVDEKNYHIRLSLR